MSSNTVWVLTSEYNSYDQYGEYFEGVFKNKPTSSQLADKGMEAEKRKEQGDE